MSQRKTLCKLTWLTFMPLLFVSSYFVMLLNFRVMVLNTMCLLLR